MESPARYPEQRIYCAKKTNQPTLKTDDYRWDLLNAMVLKADKLDVEQAARIDRRRPPTTRARARAKPDDKEDSAVGRFKGADVHHHDRISHMRVRDARTSQKTQKIYDTDPPLRECAREPRARDV